MAYVVLAPEAIRGVYDTWPECEAAVRGVRGAVYRKAADRALAERLLRGDGRKLEAGTYAFIDGNAAGGIGIVYVERGVDGSTRVDEISTTVARVAPGLDLHLPRLRNPLAELAALLHVVFGAPEGTAIRVIHDYEGTGAWMEGRWRTKNPVIAQVAADCREVVRRRGLTVTFERTDGHQSARGGDEYAEFNARADRLAARAICRPVRGPSGHSACTTGEAMV